MALLCCGTLITTTTGTAWAQPCPACDCPSPPTDDAVNMVANPPWDSGGSYCTTLDGCAASICWDYRCSTVGSPPAPCGNYDYVVTQVCINLGCFEASGDSLSGLISKATDSILTGNPHGFSCPSCPDNSSYWTENEMSCWGTTLIVNPVTGDTTEQFQACGTHGWCLNQYTVCCDSHGIKHLTFVQHQDRSYECGVGCSPILSCPGHH